MKIVRELLAAFCMLCAIQFLDWARKANEAVVLDVMVRAFMDYEHDEEIRKLFTQKVRR